MRAFYGFVLTVIFSTGSLAEAADRAQRQPLPLNHFRNRLRENGGRNRPSANAPAEYSSQESLRKVELLLQALVEGTPETLAPIARVFQGNFPQSDLIEVASEARWERDFSVVRKILTKTASIYCKSANDSKAKVLAKEVLATVSQDMGLAIAEMSAENRYFADWETPSFPSSEQQIQLREDQLHEIRLHTKLNELEIAALDSALWDAADVVSKECTEEKQVQKAETAPSTSETSNTDDDQHALAEAVKLLNKTSRLRRRLATVQIDEDFRRALFSQGRKIPPMMPGFEPKLTERHALAQLPETIRLLIEK